MSGELHEISMAIGKLEEHAAEGMRQRGALWGKLDEISHKLDRVPMIESRLDAIEPEVAAWTDARRKAAGALIVLTAMSGGIGFLGAMAKSWLLGR